MRKAISSLVIVVLFLAGCAGGDIPRMELKGKTTSDSLKEQSKPIDLATIIMGGPLYVLDEESVNPMLEAFRHLRNSRVDDVLSLIDDDEDMLDDLTGEMRDLRSEALKFLGLMADSLDSQKTEQAILKAFVFDTIDKMTALTVITSTDYINLKGLSDAASKDSETKSAAHASVNIARYRLLSNLLKSVRNELAFVTARTAGLVAVVNLHKELFDDDIISLAADYDSDIDDVMDDIDDAYLRAIAKHLDVAAGLESLKAADYAFINSVLEFTRDTLPRISESLGLVKSGAFVGDLDIAFYTTYARFLRLWNGAMDKGMKRTQPPVFLKLAKHSTASQFIPSFLNEAGAATDDWPSQASSVLRSDLSGAGGLLFKNTNDCAEGAWGCVRAAACQVQKAGSFAEDFVAVAAKPCSDWTAGRYYAAAISEIDREVGTTLDETNKAWEEGKGTVNLSSVFEKGNGAVTTRLIGLSFELTGKAPGGAMKGIWGYSGAGFIAARLSEITADMLANFGSGIMKVAHPQSTQSEIVEGTVDIAFSFIGGSRSVIAASQAISEPRQSGGELFDNGVQKLEQLSLGYDKAVLKGVNRKMRKMLNELANGKGVVMLNDGSRVVTEDGIKTRLASESAREVDKLAGRLLEKSARQVFGKMKEVPVPVASSVVKNFSDAILHKNEGEVQAKQ